MLDITHSITELQQRFDPDPRHSAQVARLSLQLFDELQALHELGSPARKLLQAAAALHDIGYHLNNGLGHHKNTLNMILQYGLPPLSYAEVKLTANIARYHRKSLPSLSHEHYRQLSENERQIVDKLSSLLRIADGMDHSHRSAVYSIHSQIKPGRVELTLKHFGELQDELSTAAKKADLFRRTFSYDIIFIPYPIFKKPVSNNEGLL